MASRKVLRHLAVGIGCRSNVTQQHILSVSASISLSNSQLHSVPCLSHINHGRPTITCLQLPTTITTSLVQDRHVSTSSVLSDATTSDDVDVESEHDHDIQEHSESSFASSVYDAESMMYPSWNIYSDVEIGNVESSALCDRVDVSWRGARPHTPVSYPLVWLRDNCRCPICFSHAAKSRVVPMRNLDINCSIEEVSPSKDAKTLHVKWSDGHVSQYPARWLRCNAFSESDPDPTVDLEHHLWDASTCRHHMQFFDFMELLNDDRALFEMLREIKVFGISVMQNAPPKLEQLHRLAKRVGYLIPSNYGETFQVQTKDDPSNAAYTSGDLPLHTDLSYFNHPPGIQMLHCIKQAGGDGGENTLVDGFKIADDLRQNVPELYDLLTKEVVEFYDSGVDAVGDFYQHSRNRVIRLDHLGKVDRIVFSDHGRSSMMRLPVNDVINMYKALTSFASLLYAPSNVFEYRLRDGDILIMDNHRVLHGRKAFTMQPGTFRHLEGGYFEWDTAMSRLRVLKNALSQT